MALTSSPFVVIKPGKKNTNRKNLNTKIYKCLQFQTFVVLIFYTYNLENFQQF